MGFALLFWSFPWLLWLACSPWRPFSLAGWAALWIDRVTFLVLWADRAESFRELSVPLAYAAVAVIALFLPHDETHDDPQD